MLYVLYGKINDLCMTTKNAHRGYQDAIMAVMGNTMITLRLIFLIIAIIAPLPLHEE